MAMLKLLRVTMGVDATVHGFRTTFRTWAQEETEFLPETVEHCLHHILGDASEKVYKQGLALKKRAKVLQAWADFATTPPKSKSLDATKGCVKRPGSLRRSPRMARVFLPDRRKGSRPTVV
jgi:hypothetical protein